MLQNAYFLAKIGADTAENEQHFAEILPKTGNDPTGPPGRGLPPRRLVREEPRGVFPMSRASSAWEPHGVAIGLRDEVDAFS